MCFNLECLEKSHLYPPDVGDGDFKILLTGSGGQGVRMQRMWPRGIEDPESAEQRITSRTNSSGTPLNPQFA